MYTLLPSNVSASHYTTLANIVAFLNLTSLGLRDPILQYTQGTLNRSSSSLQSMISSFFLHCEHGTCFAFVCPPLVGDTASSEGPSSASCPRTFLAITVHDLTSPFHRPFWRRPLLAGPGESGCLAAVRVGVWLDEDAETAVGSSWTELFGGGTGAGGSSVAVFTSCSRPLFEARLIQPIRLWVLVWPS